MDRWEQRTEWPLMAAALLFLVSYAWPILDPDLSPGLVAACAAVGWATWAVFGLDYLVRIALAEHRGRFVAHNLVDLAVVALPLLRPLRLLRVLTMLRFLNRSAATAFRGRVIIYVTGAAALLIFVAALAVLEAERLHPEATITEFGDAAWWALTTMTTVGYGDHVPVTGTGRVVASALMLGGIALLGTVTATLASWIVQRIAENDTSEQAATRAQVEALAVEIRALRNRLDR
ncbi:potassium channel family protein [Jiangella ureilytica]|uniref:potassium channel family protein n=1 Tax=Jiangella ureilytica TaxID=2530374 RepID=UPI00193E09CA|nr:potassium channel family protein [Jiangella ureilytica]